MRKSVARISGPDAVALLQLAVQRLQSKPARAAQLAVWIRALLLQHTATLMAAPGTSFIW